MRMADNSSRATKELDPSLRLGTSLAGFLVKQGTDGNEAGKWVNTLLRKRLW